MPFVHTRVEWPEIAQGLLVAGATGLAVVPLFVDSFGMTFEMAVALCVVQSVILCSSPIVFGEPFCPGWLTPALPLVLAGALEVENVGDRVGFVTAVVLLVGVLFLTLGITGLGPLFIRWVPRTLRSGIILGAGLSAILGEFQQERGTPRLEEFPITISVAVGVSLLLIFSVPIERLKSRQRWLATLAGLGLAPGFVIAMVVGPLVGEVSYSELHALFFDAAGSWSFSWDKLLFWPDFAGLVSGYSPLSSGFLDGEFWTPARLLELAGTALPLAFAAYIIGFGDIVTGTEILKAAATERDDEVIPFDERRTHLSIGIRHLVQGAIAGPFFPLQGPLWTGAMVVVAERYRRGREAMQSIFSGIFSYYVFGVPIFFFVAPALALYRPVLPIALSLTLLLTGFACAYVSLAMPRDRIERGLTLATGATIAFHSTTAGIVVGLALAVMLLGRAAWHEE